VTLISGNIGTNAGLTPAALALPDRAVDPRLRRRVWHGRCCRCVVLTARPASLRAALSPGIEPAGMTMAGIKRRLRVRPERASVGRGEASGAVVRGRDQLSRSGQPRRYGRRPRHVQLYGAVQLIHPDRWLSRCRRFTSAPLAKHATVPELAATTLRWRLWRSYRSSRQPLAEHDTADIRRRTRIEDFGSRQAPSHLGTSPRRGPRVQQWASERSRRAYRHRRGGGARMAAPMRGRSRCRSRFRLKKRPHPSCLFCWPDRLAG
jgi:hypothetical protein